MKVTFEIEHIDPTDDLTEDEILEKIESSEAYLDFNNNEIYIETDNGEYEVVGQFAWNMVSAER
jgi:hypothetical protein